LASIIRTGSSETRAFGGFGDVRFDQQTILSGSANTGTGGDGSNSSTSNLPAGGGGAGGSGIVIIRYEIAPSV
jgi:hypothetical protein